MRSPRCMSRARGKGRARKLTALHRVQFKISYRARQWAALVASLLVLGAPPSFARAQSVARADTSACRAASAAPSGNRIGVGRDTASCAADVVIYAAASVGEIRFASQPSLSVRLCGGLDSIHVIERRNLPSPVVAGTTYRNVYVAVQIFGRLTADCLQQTLTGRGAAADSTRAGSRLDCASLELHGAATPPAASAPPPTRPPRR